MNIQKHIFQSQIEHKVMLLLALLLLLCSSFLKAQTNQEYLLEVVPLDKSKDFLKAQLQLNPIRQDSTAIVNILQAQIIKLHGASYLEASVDSLVLQDSTAQAFLHFGESYQWANLSNGNVETVYLDAIGFREKLYDKKPFYYKEVQQLQESLLNYAENNGFPFASVFLDSIQIEQGQIAAQLMMRKNKFITIDEIKIEGNAKITSAYLENYLGIQKGDVYDKSKVLKIRKRIGELPFLRQKKDVSVTFKGNKATINLFLERKKASRFDFLVGLLPNTNSGSNTAVKRFLITGTFNADMANQFGLGERVFAEFKQLRPETQELDLRFSYPYLFGLPFGLDTNFDLYKRDTTFLDVEYNIGVQYLFEGGDYLKVFWNQKSSSLLTVNKTRVLNTRQLPENLDVNNNFFGIQYWRQNLDYRFNPRRGWALLGTAGAGFKRIDPNNDIVNLSDPSEPTFDYTSLYDELNLNSFQYKLELKLEKYFPLFKRSTFKTALEGSMLLSEIPLFQNEQYRLGGNKRLRGFDEETVLASRFAILTLEYRLLIGKNAYLFTFGDLAYVEDLTNTQRIFDRPIGFGAGINFETNVGVFGVSYAIGRRLENPIDFRAAKIHFGYESYF